jgi:hypothetical protein
MDYSPTECRAIEQASADSLNLLMDHLRIFSECRKQLEHIEEEVSGDATHHPSGANQALRLIEGARKNLDEALALVVEVRLRGINAST